MKKSILMTSLSAVLLTFMVQIIFIPTAFASTTYTVLPQINNNRLINGNSVSEGTTVPVELNRSQKVTFVNNGSLVLSGSTIQDDSSNDMVLLLDTSDDFVPADSSTTTTTSSDPSNYALFSGGKTGDLEFRGNSVTINGNMHSNAGISCMSKAFNVKGTIETVNPKPAGLNTTNYTWMGVESLNSTNGYTPKDLTFKFGADYQKIPDIDQNLKSQAGNNLIEIQHYNNLLDTYWLNPKNQLVGPSNSALMAPVKNQQTLSFAYMANPYGAGKTYTFVGSDPFVMDKDKTYYFDDNVIFSTGLIVKSNVKIISTGSIYVVGGTLDTTGGNAYLYSVNKNIQCIPSSVSLFNGSFYAPYGDVKFTANKVVINGNIVANNISDIPASTTINYTASASKGNTGTVVAKTSHMEKVTQAAIRFINALRSQETNKKIGVVLYNDHAYPLSQTDGYKLYSLNSNSDYLNLISMISAIKSSNTSNSNMGDGIRKSINLLARLSTGLSKNIVTLTASKPNTYTVNSAGNIYTSISGDVGTTSGVTTKTDYAGGTPLDYAKRWALNMKIAKVGSSFINCLDDTFTDFLSVGLSTESIGNAYGSKGQCTSNAYNHYVGASLSNLSSIFSNIIVQPPLVSTTTTQFPDEIAVDATFTFILPAVDSSHCFKVKPVLPNNSGYTVTDTAAGTAITKEIAGIVLRQDTPGSGKYIISPTSINIPDINLQYVLAPGKQMPLAGDTYSEQIDFSKSSNTLKLIFKDPNIVNGSPVVSNYNPGFTANVKYIVDIN